MEWQSAVSLLIVFLAMIYVIYAIRSYNKFCSLTCAYKNNCNIGKKRMRRINRSFKFRFFPRNLYSYCEQDKSGYIHQYAWLFWIFSWDYL